MIYLISQDWRNTSNNHAGIKYLCNTLSNKMPNEFYSIVLPCFDTKSRTDNRFLNKLVLEKSRWQHKKIQNAIIQKLSILVKPGDTVFVMEYMEQLFPMFQFVKKVRQLSPFLKIYAMVHLVPDKLNRNFPANSSVLEWVDPIDRVFTLGSSLSDFLIKKGVPQNKVVTTFHYVDSYYFKNTEIFKKDNQPLNVLAMGNQVRNIQLLKEVVTKSPQVSFVICQGTADMSSIFKDLENVHLIPFVSEEALRNYMENADISINVMNDTIGSNVIVTSLAMGLAMLCSDVGSIRDYCDTSNTIFCDNNCVAFSNAINYLHKNRDILYSMKINAANKAFDLTIERFANTILNLN